MAILNHGSSIRTADGGQSTTTIVTASNIGTYGVAANSTYFIGTTQNVFNRASGAQTLTGVSIDGNAATVTNGVYTTGTQTIGGAKTFSDGITVNTATYNTFTKPSPSTYQTVALFGSTGGGLFLTTDNPIIGVGAYYNTSWIATATSGRQIDFANGNFTFSAFSGATIGGAASWGTVAQLNSSGTFSATGDFRAPIFYDSANTAYYLDPANTGTSLLVAGNVGIGTTSPSNPLHINTSANEGILVQGSTAGSWMNFKSSTSDLLSIGADGTLGLGFYNRTSSTYLAIISNSGSLGIGTTSPSQKLHVVGTGFASTDFRSPIFYDSANTAYYLDAASTSSFNALNLASTLAINGGDGIRVFKSPASSVTSQIYWANGANTIAYNWQIDENNNAAMWGYGGTAWAKLLTVTSGGGVGIGTSTISQKLNISGNIMVAPVSSSWAEGLSFTMPTASTWGGLRWRREVANADGNHYIGYTGLDSTDDLVFGSNNGGTQINNNIRITKAGLVGIGTAPSQKFHVSGIGYSDTDFRAPIFYDSNNTSYYLDPASTSNLVGLTVANTITGSITGSSVFVASLGSGLNYDIDRTTKRSGLSHYSGYSTGTNRPTTYDYTLQVTDGGKGWEISMDWISTAGPSIYARSLRDCCQNWSSWVRVLDSVNYAYAYNMNQNVRTTDNVAFANVTGAIFYDAANTAYYTDPASTSVLNRIDLPSGSGAINTTTPGQTVYQLNFTGQSTNDNAQAITWGWSTSGAQAGIYVQSSGGYGTKMYIATTDSFATGSKTALTIDHTGVITTNRNYLQATGSLRAPIFYDSDNTAFYIDPASESNLRALNIDGGTINDANDATLYITAQNDNDWGIYVNKNLGGSTNFGVQINVASADNYGLYLLGGGSERFRVRGNGTVSATGDFRAPIFYDSDNTSYYINAAGASSLNTLTMAGIITTVSSGTAINFSGQSDSFGYNATAGQGTYIKGTGGTYIYGGGVFYDGSAIRTLLHSNNYSGYSTFSGSVTAQYGSFATPSLIMGDAQYGFYVASGNVYYKSASGGVHYWRNIANSANTMSLDNSGSLNLAADVRAPIFYDSNDTAYYLNPADVSYLYEPRMAYRTLIGAQSYDATLFETPVTTRPGIVVRGSYPHIEMVAAGIDNVNHGATLRFVGYDTGGATTGNFKHWVIGCPATNLTGLYFGYSPNQTNPHYGIGRGWSSGNDVSIFWILNDREVYAENGVRATIFYDRNNTAYYTDPASTSVLYSIAAGVAGNSSANIPALKVTSSGTATTQAAIAIQQQASEGDTIIFCDYDQYVEWNLVHENANNQLIVHGGSSTGNLGSNTFYSPNGTAKTGYIKHVFDMTDGNAYIGGNVGIGTNGPSQKLDVRGIIISNSDIRAPIFYDSDNTSYYLNPAGSSQLSAVYANDWFRAQGNTGLYFQDKGYGITSAGAASNSYGNASTYGSGLNGWQGWGIGSRHCFMSTGGDNIGIHDNTRSWLYYWDGTYHRFQYGYLQSANSVRGPLFYDSDNTTYYVDPASTGYSAYFAGAIQATKIGIEDAGLDCYMEITDANPTINGVGYGGEFIFYGDKSTAAAYLYYGGATVSYILQANSSLRAPIFYDSNNTSYYCDPDGNSVLNGLYVNAYYNLANNYKDIYVYGDVNTYYVVLIQGEYLYSYGRYSVTRGYNWTGPDTWYTSTHKGGLTLDWEYSGDTAWGGNDQNIRIIEFHETYSTMVAGFALPVNGGVIVWLRGGGVNGALYRIRTPIGANSTVTVYDGITATNHSSSTSFTAANSAVFSTRANTSNVASEINSRFPVRYAGTLYNDGNAVLDQGGTSQTKSGILSSSASLRAPIFYDTDNTGYYLDPNSTTSLRTVGSWRSDSSSWDGEFSGKIQYHANHWYFQAADSWLFRSSGGNNVVSISQTGSLTAAQYYTGGWFRNNSSGNGLYNESTGQHFYSDAGDMWNVASANGTQGIRLRTGGHNGTIRGYFYGNDSNDVGFLNNAGSWRVRVVGGDYTLFDGSSARAQLFYDSNDTGYYLDPAGTSNLNKLSAFTMSYNDMNSMHVNSPYVARYNGSTQYRNGTMGHGTVDCNVMFSNWGSGFIDSWGSPANAPGGSTHYVGLQGFHYNHQNNSQAYGFQMLCAGEADNRFFWRSAWPNLRSWVEMIHSGNIGSQTVATAGSCTGNAATATRTSGQSGYPHAGTGMWAFYNWGGSDGGTSAPSASTYTTGLSVGSNPGDQAYGFQIANNMWNTGLWTRNYNSGFGSWIRLLDSSNYVGYSAFTGNVDGTQFRDANNTAYYIDPASTSNLVGLTVANTITGAVSGNAGSVTINYNNDSNSTYQMLWGSGNNVYGTAGVYLNPSTDVLYANAFYDAGNTAYYLDPNSTSNLLLVKTRNTFGERIAVTAASSTTIDTQYNVTELTMSTNVSLTLSNIQSSGTVHMWTIVTVGNGTAYSIGWPAAIKWPGGTAPTITSTNTKRDIYQFVTYDGGTTIYAIIVGQNL